MRKVFSSQRLENVEAVADLLRKEGIAVKISNGRSYRSSRRATFSYDSRRTPDEVPSVWIMHSEDQPRGRQLLREMGLLESTRDPGASYLPSGRHGGDAGGNTGFFSSKRLKLGLLLLIAGGIALTVVAVRRHGAAESATPAPAPVNAAAPSPPPLIPEAITKLQVYRVDVPKALAKKLVEDALAGRKTGRACVTIDGHDPSAAFIASLATGATQAIAASACADGAGLRVGVQDYMTDGSGTGTVQLHLGADAPRVIDVEREGTAWKVLGQR